MRLMILENKRLRNTVPAGSSIVSIGSSPDCYIHLPDPRIGSHQASISEDDQGLWWLEILDTTIPTCLNRAIQKGRARLRHADEIELGSFSIRLFMESDKTREELRRDRMSALSQRHGKTLPLGAIIQVLDNAVSLSKEHLEQLTLLTGRLSQMQDIRELIPPILRAILRTLNGSRAWIGIRKLDRGDYDWSLGLTEDGTPCDRPLFSEKTQARCLEHTQYLCIPEVPLPEVKSAMAVPLVCSSGNRGMLYIENATGSAAYDENSLGTISAFACAIAMPVDAVVRQSVAKRQATAAKEEMLARSTQDAVTPKALPEWDNLLMAAYREMGSSRCCDIYDIVQLPNKTAYIILARIIADNASLPRLFGEVRAAFRSSALHMDAPQQFAMALNWIISAEGSNIAIDLASIWIDPKTNRVQFCTAGDGVQIGKIHSDGACDIVKPNGLPPIGKDRSANYAPQAMTLESGDTLFVATAGANQATNGDGQVFGIDTLRENLCDGLGDTPGHVLGELAQDIRDFVEDGDCPDDITVLLTLYQ